jgi:enoyl-CoA hydratase
VTGKDRTRIQRLGYRTPDAVAEPDQLVLVEYVSGGRVAVITLNRPHADNAITTELAAQLIEILETIAARATVRVAIITGAGDRAFSVGGHMWQRKNMTKEQWLRQLRRPIIAAVHGMAYGGGCEVAISTDFIIASDDAVFGQPEAMAGLSAGGGSPIFLPRVLPPGKAMQMLMTGEAITAQEAHRLGMVNEVHPRGELMNAVLRIAEQIARFWFGSRGVHRWREHRAFAALQQLEDQAEKRIDMDRRWTYDQSFPTRGASDDSNRLDA